MKIDRFEDMEIWKEARELAKFVFDLTSREPFINDFRFRDQISATAGSTAKGMTGRQTPLA